MRMMWSGIGDGYERMEAFERPIRVIGNEILIDKRELRTHIELRNLTCNSQPGTNYQLEYMKRKTYVYSMDEY